MLTYCTVSWPFTNSSNANILQNRLMMSPTNSGRQQQEQHQDSPSNLLTAGSYSRAASVEQPRGQPTQSRSFRILQMIHDPADDSADVEAEPTESSGRLSRSSVGSNNSGGISGGRVSQHSGPPPVGERRLNLTQDDRELMDMFRSQGNFYPGLYNFFFTNKATRNQKKVMVKPVLKQCPLTCFATRTRISDLKLEIELYQTKSY